MKLAFLLFLFILSFSLMGYGQTLTPTYGQLLGQSFQAKAKGEYSKAIGLLKEAIRLDSSEKYWRYYNLAELYTLAGEYSPAFSYLDSVLSSPIAGKVSWRNTTFKPLWDHQKWMPFKQLIDQQDAVLLAKQNMFDRWQTYWLKQRRQEYEQVTKGKKGEQLYLALETFSYQKPIAMPGSWLSLRVSVNDSVDTRCYVRLPAGYESKRPYPVLFFLHGAVKANLELPLVADSLSFRMAGEALTKVCDSLGYILAIPYANTAYNWMDPEAGWNILPNSVRIVRQLFNVAEDQIYLSGHSNGATGAFSYLLRQPTDFAGFYGFNTQPRIRTGGSFLLNAKNRSFYAIAVDKDYYYPKPALDTLTKLAHKLGISFIAKTYSDSPHGFPFTKDFSKALPSLLVHLQNQRRNVLSDSLYWECDDIKFGRCDWISIEALDTLQPSASWQELYNFLIREWNTTQNTKKDTLLEAFQFPRRSGAVKATYQNNTFTIFTSRVKEVRLLISPQMVNVRKRVKVRINNKLVYNKKIKYNSNQIRHHYQLTGEREAKWIDNIHIVLE